jgi:hypothetical protein
VLPRPMATGHLPTRTRIVKDSRGRHTCKGAALLQVLRNSDALLLFRGKESEDYMGSRKRRSQIGFRAWMYIASV